MRHFWTYFFLMAIFVAPLTPFALAEDEKEHDRLIIENVERALSTLEVRDHLKILGVNARGDEVVATVTDMNHVEFRRFLLKRGFKRDPTISSISHHGCGKSVRWPARPSLQITFFHDHVEMDIDMIGPRADRYLLLTSSVHMLREVIPHFLEQRVGLKGRTNQEKVSVALNRWERRLSRKLDASMKEQSKEEERKGHARGNLQ